MWVAKGLPCNGTHWQVSSGVYPARPGVAPTIDQYTTAADGCEQLATYALSVFLPFSYDGLTTPLICH